MFVCSDRLSRRLSRRLARRLARSSDRWGVIMLQQLAVPGVLVLAEGGERIGSTGEAQWMDTCVCIWYIMYVQVIQVEMVAGE